MLMFLMKFFELRFFQFVWVDVTFEKIFELNFDTNHSDQKMVTNFIKNKKSRN